MSSSRLRTQLIWIVAFAVVAAITWTGRGGAREVRSSTRVNVNRDVNANRNVNRDVNVNRNIDRDVNRNIDRDVNVNRNIDRDVNVNRNIDRDVNVNRDWDVDRDVHFRRDIDVDVDYHHNYHGGYRYPVATGIGVAAAATATAVAIGTMVRALPPACSVVVVNGFTYQNCSGVWYQPQYAGTQVTYVVVNAPH